MKEKYNAAILGLGRIGYTLEKDRYREKPASHFGVIQGHPKVNLLAGVDPSETARKRFSKELTQKHIFSGFDELMKSKLVNNTPDALNGSGNSLDIVHLATPTDLHLKQLEQALEYKIPLIILEKPICDKIEDYAECKRLKSKVKKSNSIVVVNHERRFAVDYNYVKQNLLRESWGNLESIDAYLYTNTQEKPREILFHDGTHLIDLIYFLVPGKISQLTLWGKNEKNSSLDFNFKKGKVKVRLEISGTKKYFHFELVLNFHGYQIKIGNGIFEVKKALPSEHYASFFSLKKIKHRDFPKTHYFKNMYAHAINLLENKEKVNLSSFADGMNLLEFMKQINEVN